MLGFILYLMLSSAGVAQPTSRSGGHEVCASLDLGVIEEVITNQVRGLQNGDAQQCDLSRVNIPLAYNAVSSSSPNPFSARSSSFTPLPSPHGTLAHVTIGRGTQNYTCSSSSKASKPQTAGAFARLYDASCIASADIMTLNALPDVLLHKLPFPDASSSNVIGSLLYEFLNQNFLIGHHYFTERDGKIGPTFNLDTVIKNNGYVNAKSGTNTTAPTGAPRGLNGGKAVAWLQLDGDGGAQSDQATFTEVYRVQTAGGSPPATCHGLPETFEIQYAAQYWFYQ